MLLGHTKQINGVWKVQSLKQHSENVAEYCARACQPLGLENLGRLTGWLHDAGKSHSNVQKYLRGQTNERINHSSAGMRWLWENYGGETASPPSRLTAQMAALAIGSHHSERMNVCDLAGGEPWIKHMYSEQAQELYEESCRAFFADCISEAEIRQMFAKAVQEVECLVQKIRTQEGKKPRLCIYQVMLGLAHRFLFAALIDADWLDSGNYYNQEGCLPPEQLPPWDLIESNVETFLNNLQPRHKIDTLRAEISEQCKTAGECAKPGIYRLYVPTGGGKTFSGLRYCVHAAKKLSVRHIFYVAPFRSIIGQNVQEFKKALGGSEYLLEHHTDAVLDTENPEILRQLERWQEAPVICTTMVQMLQTLFCSRRQNVRRMAALANSILVFDEIQSLPICHTYLFNQAANFLAYYLGCVVVLCTATQPALSEVANPLRFASPVDLVPDYQLRFAQFRRTKIEVPETGNGFQAGELAEFVRSKQDENGSILIILNTRSAVEKVFEALKQCQPEHTQLYCLTTHLCAKHRADVIAEVKQKLNTLHGQERLICVSSQLIEAGVDVSFDCVIRSMAALPSVAQASGRCNRNAERKCRTVYLVKTYNLENLDRLPELRNGREATRRLLQQLQRDADLLEPESILRYYQLYYAESQQQERMGDPVELKGYIPPKTVNLFDLLSDNRESVLAWKETTGKQKFPNYLLRQAFATAERNFHALEDITTPVVVPYGEDGADMATRLSSSESLTPKMLRDAQRFTVGITTNEKIRLADQGALYTVKEGAVTILNKEYYDDEKGIQTSPGFMPIQFA